MWRTVHAPLFPTCATRCRSSSPEEGPGGGEHSRVLPQAGQRPPSCNSTIAAFYTLPRRGRIAKIHEILDSFELVQQILETRHIAAELTANKSKKPDNRPRPGRPRARPVKPTEMFSETFGGPVLFFALQK